MADEITERDRAAYAIEPAWHQKGKVYDHPLTRAEVDEAIGWTVSVEAAYNPYGDQIPGINFIVRDDLDVKDVLRYLAPCGNGYTPIQNSEGVDLLEALCGESGAEFETAFSMKGGRKIAVLLRRPDDVLVCDDWYRPYWLWTSSHDGTVEAQIRATLTRVVCANTLSAALGERGGVYGFRHTTNVKDRIQQCQAIIAGTLRLEEQFSATCVSLSQKKVDERFVSAFAEALFPSGAKDGQSSRCQNIRQEFLALVNGGQIGYADSVATHGTRYGMLQAISEYADHRRGIRVTPGTSGPEEARADSVLFGSAASWKTAAVDLLVNRADRLIAEAVGVN